MLGLDKLTNAFGLLILFRGAAAIIGSPLAGAVYDATESYDISFYMAAAFFGISAATSFMAPVVKRCFSQELPPPPPDQLTPIDEDEEEEEEDEDGPITMGKKPDIEVTASSPPQREIKQIESVL